MFSLRWGAIRLCFTNRVREGFIGETGGGREGRRERFCVFRDDRWCFVGFLDF